MANMPSLYWKYNFIANPNADYTLTFCKVNTKHLFVSGCSGSLLRGLVLYRCIHIHTDTYIEGIVVEQLSWLQSYAVSATGRCGVAKCAFSAINPLQALPNGIIGSESFSCWKYKKILAQLERCCRPSRDFQMAPLCSWGRLTPCRRMSCRHG